MIIDHVREYLDKELTFYYAASVLRMLNLDHPEINNGNKKVKIYVNPNVYKMLNSHANSDVYSSNYIFLPDEDLILDKFKFTRTKDLINDSKNFFD